MTPSFKVPAQYFYALTANLPIDVDIDVRYQMAVSADAKRIVDNLHTAIDTGVIPAALPITPEQAARRLGALGRAQGSAPVAKSGTGLALVTQWLAYTNPSPTADPDLDIAPFWSTVLAPIANMTLTNPALAAAQLELIVCAIIKEGDSAPLISAVKAEGYSLQSVKDLDPAPFGGSGGITFAQWQQIFKNHPGAIPAFAKVGTSTASPQQALAEQTAAFLRRLTQFFNLPAVVGTTPTPSAGNLPELDKPQAIQDKLAAFVSAYSAQPGHAGFAFGQSATLDLTAAQLAAELVFPYDARAVAWLVAAADAINTVYAVANVGGVTSATRFSIAEALYARGFTSVASITALTPEDFQDALIGTPAYHYATQIQTNAGSAASPPGAGGPFGPINDGTLANCVPPLWLSPLGPVEYLHELWILLESATCEQPLGDGSALTLGSAVTARRGPLGELLATQANLETALPMLDLVNECLEQMVASGAVKAVYQTSGETLAGHPLARPGSTIDQDAAPFRHDPEVLFAALPEHSSPGAPLSGAYTKLRSDFSAPVLPYSQPLDVSRAYLGALHTTRYATMRRFRKEISEFVLDSDPSHQPADFASYRWRYPVRIEIAREYLGITPEEYVQIFTTDISPELLAQLYGFAAGTPSWMTTVSKLSEFLARTGLTYCEFLALWHSGYVNFSPPAPGGQVPNTSFPLCEPCYLDKYFLVFLDPVVDLTRLIVFIRLWQKLQQVRGAKYSFTELADIATVLQLFFSGVSINPDFIRQLAAFQMLRDDIGLELKDHSDTAAGTGADRTHLLALFASPLPRKWDWAIGRLVEHIGAHARSRHCAGHRPSEFIKLLASNLDPLSRLAGFDPSDPGKTWHTHPTHTLRFSEVLSKIYASQFGVGELLYLFTVNDALDGDDPFPLPTEEDSLDTPLDLPDDTGALSLWSLRRKLLGVEVSDEQVEKWTWARIERSLREDFGFVTPAASPDPVLMLGGHFFPELLIHAGTTVKDRQYRRTLSAADTSPQMWNAPGDGPFHYDVGAEELWVQVPLKDEEVLEKLSRIRPLSAIESVVVRDLYFLPRVDLAPFAFLFATFDEADRRLIQEGDKHKRWSWFQRSFARCHARCQLIAQHLTEHVAVATGEHEDGPRDQALAWRVLKQLLADENKPNPPVTWQSDDGTPPAVAWPQPSGGAFAALLGLLGTGLLGELRPEGSNTVLWRELYGPMDVFGRVRNEWNVPVPMVLPSLGAELPPEQTSFVDVRNGLAMSNVGGHPLGGAQGYCVHWRGVLLVEEAGSHQFFAGAHAPEGKLPEAARADGRRWRVTLRRGQKSWVVLTHDWPGEDGERSSRLPLKRGAYDISIEFLRCSPHFRDADDVHRLRTGFELKYVGPDTKGAAIPLPLHRLYLDKKDGPLSNRLGESIQGAPKQLLKTLYVSTLRDIRRTYQRAFKALLFSCRFDLSARPFADYGQSEIGYFLDNPEKFAGVSFYGSGAPWATHRAWFDLDFLPVRDPYHTPTDDDRAQPSLPRQQALFDWWERVFDYASLRRQTKPRTKQPVWLLFDEASESPVTPPEDPNQLLRYLGINATYAPLVLRYDTAYGVVAADLADERWPIRVWKAEEWLRDIEGSFAFKDVRDARPDLWAANDPGISGGNDNLMKLVQDAYLENGPPRRYDDLKNLNDGLRERARQAMLAWLCGPNGPGVAHSPKELSERLLIDVEVGLGEQASRIEEAVTAMQTFERRARLGLEQPGWSPRPGFALLWDGRYATFRVWQACRRQEIYRENWIEWSELEKARQTEGFRFLERELRRATLTVPAPGGLTYWDGERPPVHPGLKLLQAREPSTVKLLPDQPEALNLLGTPERSARRSWLASVPGISSPQLPDPTKNPSGPPTITAVAPPSILPQPPTGKLPFWIEASIRLGVRFLRIAAAGVPPASNAFAPRRKAGEAGCCSACGRRHEAVVDEYYFWLVDSRYFATDDAAQDASANWDDDPGGQNGELPKLLSWTPRPAVCLMWSRMHDGELQQPRRSTKSLAVDPAQAPWGLTFDGRKSDSLYFKVTGAAAPPAGYAATPAAGFRYDLATDCAIVVPEVSPDPPAVLSIGGLPAYPYFAYCAPGAPLIPLSLFSESVAVACTLRSHCRFEAALRWYEAFYNPLSNDTRWCWQSTPSVPPSNPTAPSDRQVASMLSHAATQEDSVCCRYSAVTDQVARQRAITLDYLETLVEWGDALSRRGAPESSQQARLVFDTAAKILGERPRTVLDAEQGSKPAPTVANLNPALLGGPLNPRLLALYDRVADRLGSIHAGINARRLRSGRVHRDLQYWDGEDPKLRRWSTDNACTATSGSLGDSCADAADWCCLPSPYRFIYLIQKAIELAGEVRSLGASLLGAFEKGDAEHLAYVRASQERQLTELALAIRKDAWRAADWDVQALRKSKESAQNQLQYYTALIAAGLNSGENDYVALTNSAIGALQAAVVSETIATAVGPIPDLFVGTVDFTWLALGTKLAGVFQGIAQISSTTSQILSSTAGLRLTQSGWDRRNAEWHHQVDIFTIEIEQIERQILAAERRRDSAAHDLNNTRRQIEQSREILNLLRDKFTSHELYLHLQKETAALYREIYELALRAARHAQRAFNIERGYTSREFISGEAWNDLREGLLAGEQLTASLRRMEKAYCDDNIREYELTRHVSLRQLFPSQFLQLKTTGRCEIEVPEWLFDLDYPGQYMRRIKNVALTIPCVAGPYTGVHCRLTLLGSVTRVVPWLLDPVASCCKETPPQKPPTPSPCGCWSEPVHTSLKKKTGVHESTDTGYAIRQEDPRLVRRYGAKEAIATSGGQNDTGLFELNFRDERYLPFEFEGAVSRWRIELPPENNYFDVETLSDVILHLNYTAREGGEVLRKAASEVAQRHVPDAGHRVFDVRQELAESWRRFESQRCEDGMPRQLELHIGRNMFLYLPGHRDVTITHLEVFFEAPDAEPGSHRKVEFTVGHRRGCKSAERSGVREFECVASAEWPGLYRGVLDVRMGPLSWREHDFLGALRFHPCHGTIRDLYVVCSYETSQRAKLPERPPGRPLGSGHEH